MAKVWARRQDRHGHSMKDYLQLAPVGRGGRNVERKFIRSQHGKWVLMTTKSHATVICEMSVDKRDECWQALTGTFAEIEYTGKQTKTKNGFECAAWNDETVHQNHKFLQTKSHNYCRNPDKGTGGPWCYTSSPAKRWDNCGVPICSNMGLTKNDFEASQAQCGQRLDPTDFTPELGCYFSFHILVYTMLISCSSSLHVFNLC